MENMIHWGIKMTMYLLQRSDKKLICPFYFSDRVWILIFLLCLGCGRAVMCTLQCVAAGTAVATVPVILSVQEKVGIIVDLRRDKNFQKMQKY